MGRNNTIRIGIVNTRRIVQADIPFLMTDPHERLKQARLRAGYEKAADAARGFGWNATTYRSHENGTRGLTPEIAKQYADAFKVTASWLLYGDKRSRNGDDVSLGELPVVDLPFGGPLEAGAFREADMYVQEEAEPVSVPRDRRYPQSRQTAYLIKGDSMDLAGLVDGMYVVAVDYIEYCDRQGDPPNGTMVIVQRVSNGGHMMERTVKEIHRVGADFEFRPKSSNSRHKPFRIPRRPLADDGTTITIIGVIIGAYRYI